MVPVVVALLLASSPGYERCMAAVDHNALGNNQMLACATADMDRADGALNARYREVMRRLPPARREALRLAAVMSKGKSNALWHHEEGSSDSSSSWGKGFCMILSSRARRLTID